MKVHWSRFERYEGVGAFAVADVREVYAAACGAGEDVPLVDAQPLVTCKRCLAVIRRLDRESGEGEVVSALTHQERAERAWNMANQLGPGPLYAKPDLIAREMFPRELVEALKMHGKHLPSCDSNRKRAECPECGGPLKFCSRPGWMNDDQWDATKAGDRYCERCKGDRGTTGYRYFTWEELPKDPCSCGLDAALSLYPEPEEPDND